MIESCYLDLGVCGFVLLLLEYVFILEIFKLSGLIQDISESGVFIKTSQAFSAGQKIQMTFMSPDYQKPFKIKGEIVRIDTDGVGVKFTIESQVQKSALKSFMSDIQIEPIGTQ